MCVYVRDKCLSGWLNWRQQLVRILRFPGVCLCGGGWDWGAGCAQAEVPWRNSGSHCEQTRRRRRWLWLPNPSNLLTARCNSTREITITPWAFGVPCLPPLCSRVTKEGATLSHQCGPVWRPDIALLEPITDSRIYTIFVLKPAYPGHVGPGVKVSKWNVFVYMRNWEVHSSSLWLSQVLGQWMFAVIGYHAGPNLDICLTRPSLYIRGAFLKKPQYLKIYWVR